MKLMVKRRKIQLRRRKKRRRVLNTLITHLVEKKKNAGPQPAKREQDNSEFRLLGSWKAGEYKQTSPPTITIS